ncbi:MAG TPA: PRC-barrel domain-containing protein [Candidatus Nitrosotenuis sp.]|nr:PRC-barrel domain-containing protein [Candidatus Nitrosotenuis sp.]
MVTRLEGMAPNLCTADEFRGKKVVDREGIEYGKVKHIHINSKTLAVAGVTIHQGFHKDYYLPTEYIDKFTEESLLLSRPPIRVDVEVVDIDGHKIGKIKRLVKDNDTNELQSIEIADGIMHTRIVAKSEIWGIGEKVILKLTKDQYKNLH